MNDKICTIKNIDHSFNREMLDILKKSPVESGGLRICFDKAPDVFLIPDIKAEHYKCAGFFINNQLVGFAMLVSFQAYVNGQPKTIMYFCNFYIKKKGRGRQFYFKAGNFFYQDTYKNSNIGFTLIMKGNKAAESYIGKRPDDYPYLPYSKPVAELVVKNILITFPKKTTGQYNIRQATTADIRTIVKILNDDFKHRLFAPVLSEESFKKNLVRKPGFEIENYYLAENNECIVGICSVWDTQPVRQNRIMKYSRKLKLIKLLYGICRPIFGFPPLPDEGSAIKDATIVEYWAENRDPVIMKELLVRIYNDYREKHYNMIIFGSCSNDPLLKAAHSFLHVNIISHIVLASRNKNDLEDGLIDTSMPYVDVSTM